MIPRANDVTARLHAVEAIQAQEQTRLVVSSAEWVQTWKAPGRFGYFVKEHTHTNHIDTATEHFIQLRIQGKSWQEISRVTWLPTKECKRLWKQLIDERTRLLPSKPRLRWSTEGTSRVLRNHGYQVARVYRLPGLSRQGFQFRINDGMIGVRQEERAAMDAAKWLVLQMLTQRQGRKLAP